MGKLDILKGKKEMIKIRAYAGVLLMVLFMLLKSITAAAAADCGIDLDQTGTITITMLYNESPVTGGTLALYRVGDVAEENGNYTFAFTSSFSNSGVNVLEINWENTSSEAQTLSNYISDESALFTAEADSQGKVQFTGVRAGLYLVVQSSAAAGYEKIDPFLISLPQYDAQSQSYQYTIDATPKVGMITKTTPGKTTSTSSPPSKLPQTGQLNWPVPFLAFSGLVLFLTGWSLFYIKKQKQNSRT